MSWKEVFTDENHVFSWRKSLTGIAAALFIAACIIYWAGGKALPQEYMIVISGVFAFYFFKDRMKGQNGNGAQYNNVQRRQNQPYGYDRNPYGNYQPPPQYPQDNNGNSGKPGDDGTT